VSGDWAQLAWRAVAILLVVAWFLLLIGGVSLGGLVHLVLLAAAAVFGYQLVADSSR
jgi:hypothetical protein